MAGTTPIVLDAEAECALDRMRRISPAADPLARLPDVHPARIPRHIAIIMDGNGRWAAARGFARIFGHRNGASAVRTVVEECGRLGVEALTLYAFSSENWSRPSAEVGELMYLAALYMEGEREAMVQENVRFRLLGRRSGLPTEVRDALSSLETATAGCTGPALNIAMNYGSRAELTEAVRRIAAEAAAGAIDPGSIDERTISDALDTAGLPDPDLLIRTAGERRLSNFLLWQISYAELHITETLWPDFGIEALHAAVRDFASRERRFGGLGAGSGGLPNGGAAAPPAR